MERPVPNDLKCAKLITDINSTFQNVQYTSHQSTITIDARYDCEEISEQFSGKDWRDIPFQMLIDTYSALYLFTPEAFHYFLPAFMLASLSDDDDMLWGHILAQFCPSSTAHNELRRRAIAGLLSDDQRSLVMSFFEYHYAGWSDNEYLAARSLLCRHLE